MSDQIQRLREVRLCDVPECGRVHRANGLCTTHLSRLARHGTLDEVPRWESAPKRLWAKVDKTPTCWLWTGVVSPEGYGAMTVDYKRVRVHRLSWQICRGPLKSTDVLDHLCRVRHCVNPDHLEIVDTRTNALRGIGITAINSRKTHCLRGHPFDAENTYRPPGSPGRRNCKQCMADRRRDRRSA